MRALALLLLPLSLALAPAAATPLACAEDCFVPSSGATGFFPPVLVLASGATVTWSAADPATHVNMEDTVGAEAVPCFAVPYTPDRPGSATFVVADGALLASQDGATWARCAFATMLPSGAALVTYTCRLHPVAMHGALVVEPPGA